MTDRDDQGWLDAIRQRELLLGEDTVRRMAELFIEEVDPLLTEAAAALRSGRTETARKVIHHLGGSAGCLDFADLVQTLHDAERACVDGMQQKAIQQIAAVSPLARSRAEQLRHHYRLT